MGIAAILPGPENALQKTNPHSLFRIPWPKLGGNAPTPYPVHRSIQLVNSHSPLPPRVGW